MKNAALTDRDWEHEGSEFGERRAYWVEHEGGALQIHVHHPEGDDVHDWVCLTRTCRGGERDMVMETMIREMLDYISP